jgi:hypothetical protein
VRRPAEKVISDIPRGPLSESRQFVEIAERSGPQCDEYGDQSFLRQIARGLGVPGAAEDQRVNAGVEQPDELFLSGAIARLHTLDENALIVRRERAIGH